MPSFYSIGFDYKICLWNLSNPKKSKSYQYQEYVSEQIGAQNMAFNPPFCYSACVVKSPQGEKVLLGLGNGTVLRVKRGDLKPMELSPELHQQQITSMKHAKNLLLTCSTDNTIGMHSIKEDGEFEGTTLKIQLEDKPTDLTTGHDPDHIYFSDVTGLISKLTLKQ